MLDSARRLCRLDELPPGGCREFRLGEGDWPLRGFVLRLTAAELARARPAPTGRNQAVDLRAYVNRCRHMPFPLNYLPDDFLSRDGQLIECRMHGALFEKDTGLCVRGPCLGRSLSALAVSVQEGWVMLAEPEDVGTLAARHA